MICDKRAIVFLDNILHVACPSSALARWQSEPVMQYIPFSRRISAL